MTAFTLYPGLSTAPSCVAAPFTAAPQPLTAAASLQFAFCYALSGAAGWSVVTSGVFTAAPFAFSSFNSNNQLLYYVGTGMTGTRTYLSSASATPQQSAITGLPGPGGDGQYDQKLYFNSSYLLDSGGWGYYVSPAAQVYGLTGSSSTVRLYNAGSNVSGPWLEAGLPQLQSTSLAQITASAFYLTPYSGQLYSGCTPTSATLVAASSSSGSPAAAAAPSSSSSSTGGAVAAGPSSSAAAAPVLSASSSSSSSAGGGGGGGSSGLSSGSVAAIVLGVVLGVLLLALLCLALCFLLRPQQRKEQPTAENSKVAVVHGSKDELHTSEASVGSRAQPDMVEMTTVE